MATKRRPLAVAQLPSAVVAPVPKELLPQLATLTKTTPAGDASIGWMTAVNFMIASDFKWVLLALVFPWALAVALYWTENRRGRPGRSG
jgi:hypothetical protein